jgi:uncharacterized C2H2 Zn-finger protein
MLNTTQFTMDKDGHHQCPHCSMRFGQINEYFSHIELFHSNSTEKKG